MAEDLGDFRLDRAPELVLPCGNALQEFRGELSPAFGGEEGEVRAYLAGKFPGEEAEIGGRRFISSGGPFISWAGEGGRVKGKEACGVQNVLRVLNEGIEGPGGAVPAEGELVGAP
jgi:hypothetical protein